MPLNPLNDAELHRRLILQSLADQVSHLWNDVGADSAVGREEYPKSRKTDHVHKIAVHARDFMVIQVPGHELVEEEIEIMRNFSLEADSVKARWEQDAVV